MTKLELVKQWIKRDGIILVNETPERYAKRHLKSDLERRILKKKEEA